MVSAATKLKAKTVPPMALSSFPAFQPRTKAVPVTKRPMGKNRSTARRDPERRTGGRHTPAISNSMPRFLAETPWRSSKKPRRSTPTEW